MSSQVDACLFVQLVDGSRSAEEVHRAFRDAVAGPHSAITLSRNIAADVPVAFGGTHRNSFNQGQGVLIGRVSRTGSGCSNELVQRIRLSLDAGRPHAGVAGAV